jgi:hypothetical protein
MHEPFLNSDWGTLVGAAPLLVILLAGFFRIDSFLAAPRRKRRASPGADLDKDGRTILTDPDSRPWHPTTRRSAE